MIPIPKAPSAGIVSPWADPSTLLPALIAKDLFGLDLPVVTRAEAIKVPAIAKGRAILHAVLGSRPLRAYQYDPPHHSQVQLEEQPTWLYRTDGPITPRMRTKLILDDLIFNEASLLYVTRGAGGAILSATHVEYSRWYVDQEGVVRIDNLAMRPEEIIWIPGPGPGLLVMAREAIPAALSTDRAWAARVRNPFPALVLRQLEDVGLTQKEQQEIVDQVAAGRRSLDSAVMLLPYGWDAQGHQADQTDLFEGGRNALRLDFANYLNMPASLLDGSVSTASLTYSTQEGRRNDFLDMTIPYWGNPIEDAFSQDAVVPRGTAVRFDFSDYIAPAASPTGPTVED